MQNTEKKEIKVEEKVENKKEFKKLKDLTMEEIKDEFKKVKCTFYKTTSRDKMNVNYNVKLHIMENVVDCRMQGVTQQKYMYEMALLNQDLNSERPVKTGAYCRFSIGKKDEDGSMYHLVEVIFNKNFKASFFLDDVQVDILKMAGKYDSFNWLQRPSKMEFEYLMIDEKLVD